MAFLILLEGKACFPDKGIGGLSGFHKLLKVSSEYFILKGVFVILSGFLDE